MYFTEACICTEASPCLIRPGFLAAELILIGDTCNMQTYPSMGLFACSVLSALKLDFAVLKDNDLANLVSRTTTSSLPPHPGPQGRLPAHLAGSYTAQKHPEGISADCRSVLAPQLQHRQTHGVKRHLGDMILLLVSGCDCASQKNYIRANTV